MNLVVDVGNTWAKVGLFKNGQLMSKNQFLSKEINALDLQAFIQDQIVEQALFCSVVKTLTPQNLFPNAPFPVLTLEHISKLNFENLYQTPQSLGSDRIALIAGAVALFPAKEVLVVSAGTCLTYDFKNDQDQYLGGRIAPGLQMRYRALHEQTDKLPQLSIEAYDLLSGDTTETAIHAGVFGGMVNEIESVIDKFVENHPTLTVILTGGDTNLLVNSVKKRIFAHSILLMTGLNALLEINNKKHV